MIRTIQLSPNAYELRQTIGGGEVRDLMPYEGATGYVTDGERYGVQYEDGTVDWLGNDLARAFGDGITLEGEDLTAPQPPTGDEIRAFRSRMGWTQEAASRALGLTRGHLADLERGAKQAQGYLRLAMERLEMSND